ncbi:lipopolysaccharide biosynthesis protein [Terrarubrum flagellatum]|uniref:lipopolysaccharide biosynthesis protein n=1 Tax=Terrirubrum flagellatum TaxID=2895980 RepID=UPI0031452A00
MTIILTFIVNSFLNFVLGLALAKFLGPDDFGRYAIAMAFAVLVNSVMFDWIRLSTARFYSEKVRAEQPALRGTLDFLVACMSFATFGLLAAAVLAGVDFRVPTALACAATVAGLCMALFDFGATLTRARFLDRSYSLLVIVKNIAAFILMVGGAWITDDPLVVLIGSALSSMASLLLARRVLHDHGADLTKPDWTLAKQFALYGLPLMAANMFYQLITFMNRAMIADAYGYAEAGQFALATDMGIRIFATLGSALDIFLFQVAVRADEQNGRAHADQQLSRNMSLVLALCAPLAAGYWLALPMFEALIVPADYRGHFAAYSTILIPAMFCYALVLYALNPVFQIQKRTWPVIGAAFIAVIVNAIFAKTIAPSLGPSGFAWAQFAGYSAALVMVFVASLVLSNVRPALGDVLRIVAATALMTLCVWPLRDLPPGIFKLALIVALGGAIYVGMALALNIADGRSILRDRLAARKAGAGRALFTDR